MIEGIIILAIIVGLLLLTKPSSESFNDRIRSMVRQHRQNGLGAGSVTNMIFGGTVDKMIRGSIAQRTGDCLLFQIGVWETQSQKATYIGLLNSWICIECINK